MPKLQSATSLIFVGATRNTGYSEKKKKDYDMATIELSDGIASLELPLKPTAHPIVSESFFRGDQVNIVVGVTKQFGRASFEVIEVTSATPSK